MYIRLLAVVLAPLLLQPNPPGNPGPRSSASLIYFPPSSSLLLVDGFIVHPPSGMNEVWEWNGKHWSKKEAAGPDSKSLSSGDYDSKNHQLVIFGGIGEKGYQSLHGDTWSFNGSEWRRIITNPIGTRDHHRVVYLTDEDEFLLYGGVDSLRNTDSATWLLKGDNWVKMDIPGPGSRYHFGMAYDPGRKVAVFYGGYTKQGLHEDTWEFDGKAWKQIPVSGPGPRGRFSMTYDPERKMVLLFGGDVWKKKVDKSVHPDGEIWDLRGDLWGFDGKQWLKISGDGPPRMMASLAYDPIRKNIVVVGGGGSLEETYADTWIFDQGKWTRVINGGSWKWNGSAWQKLNDE